MISVTNNAADQIHKLLVKERGANGGLRVGVKAGGCSGFEYVFERRERLGLARFAGVGIDGARRAEGAVDRGVLVEQR